MTMEMIVDQPEETSEYKANEKSHSKEVSDHLTDYGGLYDLNVKPMLQKGHEGELCKWLKEMSLIRSNVNCTNEKCNGKNLTWSIARLVDKYSWHCSECKKKQNLRQDSFFVRIKCDLKFCMQIILAWCQALPSESVCKFLDIKEHVVKKVYEKLAQVVEQYIRNHSDEWLLGGIDKILIVDEFPGGYMSETIINTPVLKKRNNNCHTILCIAEIDKIPPRMWMHIIHANPEPSSKNAKNQKIEMKCGIVEEALNEICAHAKPGSYLIANKRARCCNYESLKELKEYRVISLEDLQTHDTPGKNELLSNLEIIWQTGIGICEEIQEATQTVGLQYLYVHLWRQRFATTTASAFQYIIQHITECYPFT